MAKVKRWQCSESPELHVFDEYGDGYCHIGTPFHGILLPAVDTGPPPPPPPPPLPEVGLCVILMDASSSMSDPAFEGSPLSRMRLVSTSAASGIFDLERMQSNPYAYVAAFKFDDRIELMFVDTVASLLERFRKDVKQFADYLYQELERMQQGTDINQALAVAYQFIQQFLNKQLTDFPIREYEPMKQIILTHRGESLSVANVRVLIYTDGMQFNARQERFLQDNPFRKKPLPGLNHDVVIGAFFGQETDDGYQELKSLLSRCPIHDELQFLLIDHPARVSVLKNLFRMASGASGFCPRCLDKQLKR